MRHSSRHGEPRFPRRLLQSAYRCRECNGRFWAIPRRMRRKLSAAAVVLALVVGASLPLAIYDRLDRHSKPPVAARVPDGIEEYRVARRYVNGEGVPKSTTDAFIWLNRSAHQGYTPAQYELGMALRDGIGASADPQRAWTWLRLAAESGEPRAQFELGLMYAGGRDTPIDLVSGYIWLTLAAAKGVEGASEARAALVARMSPDQVARADVQVHRLSETVHAVEAQQN